MSKATVAVAGDTGVIYLNILAFHGAAAKGNKFTAVHKIHSALEKEVAL